MTRVTSWVWGRGRSGIAQWLGCLVVPDHSDLGQIKMAFVGGLFTLLENMLGIYGLRRLWLQRVSLVTNT